MIVFGHLHTCNDRKMEKVGNFKRKKLKIDFRVLNNSATLVFRQQINYRQTS